MTLSAFRDAGAFVRVLVAVALVCVSAVSLPHLGDHEAVPLHPSLGDGQALESKVLPSSGLPLVPVTLAAPSGSPSPAFQSAGASTLVEGRPGLRQILRC